MTIKDTMGQGHLGWKMMFKDGILRTKWKPSLHCNNRGKPKAEAKKEKARRPRANKAWGEKI